MKQIYPPDRTPTTDDLQITLEKLQEKMNNFFDEIQPKVVKPKFTVIQGGKKDG
jgi:hypothetical protein